jgi:hypothetical protein
MFLFTAPSQHCLQYTSIFDALSLVGEDSNAGRSFSGPRKGDDMLEFIKQKVEDDKGFARVEILDTLAQQFRDAPDVSTILSQLTEKAGSLTEDAQKTAGEIYVKYGQKAAEKVCNTA